MNEQKCRGHMSAMHRAACPICNPNKTVPELNAAAGSHRPSKTVDKLLKRVGARIPASVTPATRIEIHPSEWIELANEVAQLKYDLEMAHGPSGPSVHETAAPQAPIAWVVVADNGGICASGSYAPGLPPGNHDLYCVPDAVAPMMRAEETAATPRYLRPWVGTASMFASEHKLAVTDQWCQGWNACLDALDAKGCETERYPENGNGFNNQEKNDG